MRELEKVDSAVVGLNIVISAAFLLFLGVYPYYEFILDDGISFVLEEANGSLEEMILATFVIPVSVGAACLAVSFGLLFSRSRIFVLSFVVSSFVFVAVGVIAAAAMMKDIPTMSLAVAPLAFALYYIRRKT